jgi:hypothetical protein
MGEVLVILVSKREGPADKAAPRLLSRRLAWIVAEGGARSVRSVRMLAARPNKMYIQ